MRAFPGGQGFRRKCGRLEVVVEVFVFAKDDRVINRHRLQKHRVSIFDRRRRHHDEPRIMGVERLHALAMKGAASRRAS